MKYNMVSLVKHPITAFHIVRATKLSNSGDLDGAQHLLMKAVKASPDDMVLLTNCAKLAMKRKDWDVAVETWEKVMSLCFAKHKAVPKGAAEELEQARLAKAALLQKSGGVESAGRLIDKVLEASPDHVAALTQSAQLAMNRKNWDVAVETWEKVISLCSAQDIALPKGAVGQLEKARWSLVEQLHQDSCLGLSLKVLSDILSANPKDYDALVKAAEIHAAMNNHEMALTAYARALDIDRRRVSKILKSMAESYMANNQSGNADSIATGAVLCGLTDVALLEGLVERYTLRNDWEGVVDILSKVLLLHPQAVAHAQIARRTVEAFYKTGRSEEGCEIMGEAIRIAEKRDMPFKQLAILNEINRKLQRGDSTENDVSEQYYDDIYESSPAYKKHGAESAYLPVWSEVIAQINHANYRRVLDLGCGPGQFAQHLLGRIPGLQYTGMDFSSVAINAAKKRCPDVEFVQADVFRDGVLDAVKFDVVLLLEVLEHMHLDLDLLRKLPSGSRIIASVPNFDSFGHVRYFSNIGGVEERYRQIVNIDSIKPVSIAENSLLFVMKGVVK